MTARIGLPGNSYHTYQRGLNKAAARLWVSDQLAQRWPDGDLPIDAKGSVITEREADRARYRDGTPCYPGIAGGQVW